MNLKVQTLERSSKKCTAVYRGSEGDDDGDRIVLGKKESLLVTKQGTREGSRNQRTDLE